MGFFLVWFVVFVSFWGYGGDFCEKIHLSVSLKNMPDFLVAFVVVLSMLVSCLRNELTAVCTLALFTGKYQKIKA